MTRVTKMKRKRAEKASDFVSKDLKESHSVDSPVATDTLPLTEPIATDTSEDTPIADSNTKDQPKKRIRHRNEKTKPTQVNLTKQEKEILKRRSRREKQKERKMECFLCRQKEHSIASCPKNTSGEKGVSSTIGSICYRCGSLEHTLSKCTLKPDANNSLPYSTCFICKNQGHLSGQCPQNDKGVYPNGGSCKHCGSIRHLSFQCKPLKNEEGNIMLGTMDMEQGGDDDDVHVALKEIESEKVEKPLKKKPKVIRF